MSKRVYVFDKDFFSSVTTPELLTYIEYTGSSKIRLSVSQSTICTRGRHTLGKYYIELETSSGRFEESGYFSYETGGKLPCTVDFSHGSKCTTSRFGIVSRSDFFIEVLGMEEALLRRADCKEFVDFIEGLKRGACVRRLT